MNARRFTLALADVVMTMDSRTEAASDYVAEIKVPACSAHGKRNRSGMNLWKILRRSMTDDRIAKFKQWIDGGMKP